MYTVKRFGLIGICLLLLSEVGATKEIAHRNIPPLSVLGAPEARRCSSQQDLMETVRRLTLGDEEADKAEALLRSNSHISRRCRSLVIEELSAEMSQKFAIRKDNAHYNLWVSGAKVLSRLHAVEALDLLISHLTLNDGTWSFGDTHRPAAGAVINLGPVAVPKLSAILHESPDKLTRLYAVYCLGLIGGSSAQQSLSKAVDSESDPCVRKFIQLSIAAFQNRKLPNHITSPDRTKWLLAFNCPE
jgi:HEAT repeat protein